MTTLVYIVYDCSIGSTTKTIVFEVRSMKDIERLKEGNLHYCMYFLSKGKIFLSKLNTTRDGPAKIMKQGRDENTKRLHYYRKIVVKKD